MTGTTAQETGHVYALLADGTTVEIRPAGPDDFDAVKAMHEAMSPDNTYMRFFNLSRLAAETEARRICHAPSPDQVALLALADGKVAGCASYVTPGVPTGQAEVAFAVTDHMHHRGIATLLLEHLVSWARSQQITAFTAQTLSENRPMLNLFADAGLPIDRHYADGVYEMTFALPAATLAAGDGGTALDSYLAVVAERERRADVASLRHVLAPESVVVIGASRRRGTAGRAILDNIAAGGYAGRLYTVNPRARQINGERCLPSVLDLPEPADLAVIALPAAGVLNAAEQCGQRGVRALVVITAGLNTAACADLLAVCRRHGMRLVGPDCFGVAVPGIGLNATFAAEPPKPGAAGVVMQSGGLGFALMDQLSRLGVGVSSFVSVGAKLDVSSNDMLLWGAAMPVLTVLTGHPAAGQEALFAQAGVIVTHGYGELIETAALLATQPVPAGRTVAIVSNVGSAGLLAAGACAEYGLTVHRPHGLTRRRLRALVPATGIVTGPVDLTATVSGEDFRQCLELLAADDEVNAIITLILPTGATGDLVAAVAEADISIPVTAVVLNQPESVRLLPRPNAPGGEGRMPAYAYPEAAVAAMGRAASYGAWRAEPPGHVPGFAGIRAEDARRLTREFVCRAGGSGFLSRAEAAELLDCYGITLATGSATGTEVTLRVIADHAFGPLVVFGLGGVVSDQSARLIPLTDTDADKLTCSVRPTLVLAGADGDPAADLGALRDLLLRVSRLADDLPEVIDLDLSPVIVRPDGVAVTDARITMAPQEPQDPFLRKLR
jgi:acyl-CoA synthetase (NDP forming)/GNAT superfamily N-acetyltransferase